MDLFKPQLALPFPVKLLSIFILIYGLILNVSNTQAREILVSPQTPDIMSNDSLQFYAQWENSVNIFSAQESVHWSMVGCGKVLKLTGLFYPPKDMPGDKCTALIMASFIDNPDNAGFATLTIYNHRKPSVQIKPVPVVSPTPVTVKPAVTESTVQPASVSVTSSSKTPRPENYTSTSSLVVYPGINQYQSNRFSVKLSQNGNHTDSFIYQSNNSSNPAWKGTLDFMQSANHWTTFSFAGSVNVAASRRDGKKIQTCIVRPLSLNIRPAINGDTCSFTLSKPGQISVEIDENTTLRRTFTNVGGVTKQIVKHPLLVFANPLERNVPKASDPGVLYFGPGIHRIGKQVAIANGTDVYLAGGAYVIGTFRSAVESPNNISIRGRGILSAIGLTEVDAENTQWHNHSIDFSNGRRGSNLLVEGITITDPLRSCIASYSKIHIDNVKLLSWDHRNDGITAGRRSVVENSFIKVEDDNIKLYHGYQTIRHNVIWQQTSGSVFKLAWSLLSTSEDHKVYDIDVIHSDVFSDYSRSESDRPDMRSTSAIFSAMGFKRNSAFKNTSFKDIRIEEKHLLRLMSLRMVSSHQAANDASKIVYWGDPAPGASKLIDGLSFENIQLADVPYKQSTVYGNNGGSIRNIHFKNLKVNGSVIDNQALLGSKNDGSGLLTAGDVANITFSR